MRAFEHVRQTPPPERDMPGDGLPLHIKIQIPPSPAPTVYLTQPALRPKKRPQAGLARLADAAVLVLLTPILLRPDRSPEQQQQQPHARKDPFEDLGRILSAHHPRVRHLPYLPGAPLTDVHQACLARAEGIVVVVDEPPAESRVSVSSLLNGGPPTPHSPTAGDLLDDQLNVARQASNFAELKKPPGSIVLVAMGALGCRLETRVREHPFDLVVRCAAKDDTALRTLASELFGEPSNSPHRLSPKRRSQINSP